MKNNKFIVLVFAFILLLIAACNNGETTTKEPNANNDVTPNTNENNANNNLGDTNDGELANLTESGMPIVKEPVTLKFMTGKPPTTANDYNDVLIWKEYQEMSGVEIDWELVQTDGLTEKRNLALAGGNIPDVFFSAQMPVPDLLKYGQQGYFIPLNDLIKEHMPNLTKLFEQYPEVEKGITFPDGNIYSLPTIFDPDYVSGRLGMSLWIRQDWLDELGMDMPETTDQFYDYLKAVKETDLLGDGSGKEVPYGAHNIDGIRDVIKGSFGIGNRGHGHQYIDLDPETEKVRFFSITDQYKEMLEYLNKLYSEDLIQENIFTIETDQSFAMGTEGLYGSVVISNPETVYGEMGKNFVGMPALEGPHGDRMVTRIGSTLSRMGEFVVTKENKYPATTLRWMDYFYSDEGATLFFMGVEGETYEVLEDGEIDYLDEIKNSSEGLTLEQELAKYITWLGGGYPGIVKEKFFKGSSSLQSGLDAAERVKPYIGEEIWPPFLYTDEENKEMASLKADIEKYVDEMRDKFINGSEPFSEWDKYVKTIENMGLEKYMEIQQDAYERFKNN